MPEPVPDCQKYVLHREYATQIKAIDERFLAVEKYYNARIEEMKQAVSVANSEANRRLEGMNEFRDQIKDERKNFVTRPELFGVAGLVVAIATAIAAAATAISHWMR